MSDLINNGAQVFNTLLNLQEDLELRWNRLPYLDNPEGVSSYIRETILCVEDELHEVLHEVHWKPWKSASGIKDIRAYREELADVLHFILDLYLVAGLTGEDIIKDYVTKNEVNQKRTQNPHYIKDEQVH